MAYKPQAGAQMAAPNVIPMADIMLVLLIIFMVVTPMLQKTQSVDLASTDNPRDMKDADKDDAIVVAITSDGTIYMGNTRTAKEELTSTIKDRLSTVLTILFTSRATRAPNMAASSKWSMKFDLPVSINWVCSLRRIRTPNQLLLRHPRIEDRSF